MSKRSITTDETSDITQNQAFYETTALRCFAEHEGVHLRWCLMVGENMNEQVQAVEAGKGNNDAVFRTNLDDDEEFSAVIRTQHGPLKCIYQLRLSDPNDLTHSGAIVHDMLLHHVGTALFLFKELLPRFVNHLKTRPNDRELDRGVRAFLALLHVRFDMEAAKQQHPDGLTYERLKGLAEGNEEYRELEEAVNRETEGNKSKYEAWLQGEERSPAAGDDIDSDN